MYEAPVVTKWKDREDTAPLVIAPRLLDLFCGAGGAAKGYHEAGFEIVGVDIVPQPNYPYEFHQADAMTYPLEGFDVIHASPPCQRFARSRHLGKTRNFKRATIDLLQPTIDRLQQSGIPYIVENVLDAPMETDTNLMRKFFRTSSTEA